MKMYVFRVGMLTPLGINLPMTVAAVRAGISAYSESEHIGKHDLPIKMARVPEDALPPLHEELRLSQKLSTFKKRLIQLSAHALLEACDYSMLKNPIPIFLAGPEPGVNGTAALDRDFLASLKLQTGINFDLESSRILHLGRAGGFQAIELAFKYIESTGQDFVIVGGVDSYHDYLRLGHLDAEDRLLTAATMDGFVPGEGAGFLLLMSETAAKRAKENIHTCIYRPGLASEKGHLSSDEPYQGDGLAAAVRMALAHGDAAPVKAVYTSLNGEHYWGKELGVSLIRNQKAFSDSVTVEHPADCFGDLGAALGPVMIGLMGENTKGHYLGYCSSDSQARSAVSVLVQ